MVEMKAFENIEKSGSQNYFPFPTMHSTLSKKTKEFAYWAILNLLHTDAFSFDQAKILLLDKELRGKACEKKK